MSGYKYLFLLFIFLYYITIIRCEADEKDLSRAITCISVINRKLKDQKDPDPKIFSKMLLKCFITISDEQIKEIMLNLQSEKEIALEESEIIKLTEISNMETEYNEREIKLFSKRLNKAIEKFKKIQEEGYSDENENDGDDNNNKGGNILSVMYSGLTNVFKIANSFGGVILVLIGLFFGLNFAKNICSECSKNKKKNKKKDNKEKNQKEVKKDEKDKKEKEKPKTN